MGFFTKLFYAFLLIYLTAVFGHVIRVMNLFETCKRKKDDFLYDAEPGYFTGFFRSWDQPHQSDWNSCQTYSLSDEDDAFGWMQQERDQL